MPHDEMMTLEVRVREALLRRLLQGEPTDLASLSANTRLRPEGSPRHFLKIAALGSSVRTV